MFPLLRASPSFSHSPGHDQATDGRMRATAPPRDTASVFFHRSACWPSPSSRPEHDLENLQAFDETMRPRRYLERNRDCVRTGFAPGRPPPVRPRLTGACAAMRGFQICVSGDTQMQSRYPHAPALRPSSRCQTARRVILSTQPVSFPRRISAPGLVSILSHPTRRGVGGAPTGALSLLSR
jgi:hypothetical protein